MHTILHQKIDVPYYENNYYFLTSPPPPHALFRYRLRQNFGLLDEQTLHSPKDMLQRACSRQQLKANIRPESLQQFCLITCVHILGYHGAEKLFCFTKRQKMGVLRPVKIIYLPTSVIGKNRLPCPFHPLSLSPSHTHSRFLSLSSLLSFSLF